MQRLEVGARRLDLLLQRFELALNPIALGLRGGFDLRFERLAVGVEPLLGVLLLRLGVGLELLDLLLDLAKHRTRHLA